MPDFLDAVAALAHCNSGPELERASADFIRGRGFGAIYLVSPIGRDTREGRILTNYGFDDTWARAYRRWLHRADPLPEIILTRPQVFRWSQASQFRDLSYEEQRYLAMLKQRGMGDGLIIPLFGPTARCAMAGLGLHPDLDSLSEHGILQLRIFLQMAYLRYCELISAEFEQDAILSSREKDVLLWMSRGKSNAAIATILDISTDTVDTYVRRIFKKFEVKDRVAAVLAAVRHGYVIAANYPRNTQPRMAESQF